MREIRLRNEDRDGAIGYLRVGIMRSHDAVDIADHDRFDLKRAKLAMTAFGLIVSTGFDLNEGGEKQWMHDLMRFWVVFVGFTARFANVRFPFALGSR